MPLGIVSRSSCLQGQKVERNNLERTICICIIIIVVIDIIMAIQQLNIVFVVYVCIIVFVPRSSVLRKAFESIKLWI